MEINQVSQPRNRNHRTKRDSLLDLKENATKMKWKILRTTRELACTLVGGNIVTKWDLIGWEFSRRT